VSHTITGPTPTMCQMNCCQNAGLLTGVNVARESGMTMKSIAHQIMAP